MVEEHHSQTDPRPATAVVWSLHSSSSSLEGLWRSDALTQDLSRPVELLHPLVRPRLKLEPVFYYWSGAEGQVYSQGFQTFRGLTPDRAELQPDDP